MTEPYKLPNKLNSEGWLLINRLLIKENKLSLIIEKSGKLRLEIYNTDKWFILSSSEKAKPTFLVPLVCLNHRSSETKFSIHSYYLQNNDDLTLMAPSFR